MSHTIEFQSNKGFIERNDTDIKSIGKLNTDYPLYIKPRTIHLCISKPKAVRSPSSSE